MPVPGLRGDFGLKAGTAPLPGIYLMDIFFWYSADKVVGANGRAFERGHLDLLGDLFGFVYTTHQKIAGAYYTVMAGIGVANSAFEVPVLGIESGWGPADFYFQPINLGWHFKQGDITLWYGLYVPSGRYVLDGLQNTGQGVWSNEYDVGTTLYFGSERRVNLSALAGYQSNSGKHGTTRKPGSTLHSRGRAGLLLQGRHGECRCRV